MRRARRFAALAIAAATAAAAAPPADAAKVLAGLQAWLDGTRTLAGRFEQELVSGALGGDVVESGKIWVERPGRIRWEYTHPESKTAIVVDDTTLLYLASERQMITGRLDASTGLLPALLAGDRPLAVLFDASDPGPADDGAPRIALVPKGREDALESITLTLDPRTDAIREAEVLDAAGNRMRYRFSGLRRNGPLDDGLFRFEPPPGTEIVRGS